MTLKEYAISIAKRGVAVFPLKPGGKDPDGRLAPRGFRSATTDPETVAQWWDQSPDANIGAVPGSAGYVVLDVDVKDGDAGAGAPTGKVSLDTLELMHGDLPPTLRVNTPSGGYHLWYKLPEGMEAPGNAAPADGIDVRSAAGYVVAPPSRLNDGGSYDVDQSSAIPLDRAPALPDAWRPVFASGKRHAPRADAAGARSTSAPEPWEVDLDLPRDVERARAHAQKAPPAIEGQDGSLQTYKVACELRGYGISEDTCFGLMRDHYNPRCAPPWDDDPDAHGPDALATRVASAYRNARAPAGEHSISRTYEAFADIPATEAPAQPAQPTSGVQEASNTTDELGEVRKTREARFLTDEQVDEAEPPEWDIVDTLPRQSLVALFGEPGTHKSFLALDWAYHLAHGMDWAGYETDEPRRVLYVAGEGTTGIQKRLRAWRAHHNAGMSRNLTVSPDMPRIADEDAWAEWVNDLRAAGEFDFIVFDTLAYLTLGLEENSNSDMMAAIGKLNKLREDFGATVMVVHHTGKNGGDMRGATAILGACDTTFKMERGEVDGASVLSMKKQKDAEKWIGKLSLQGAEYTVGRDTRGRDITSLALAKGHQNDVPTRQEQKANENEARQLEHAEARKQEAASEAMDAEQMAGEVDAILRHHGGVLGVRKVARLLALERYGEVTGDKADMLLERLRRYAAPDSKHRLREYVAQRDGREKSANRKATFLGLEGGA